MFFSQDISLQIENWNILESWMYKDTFITDQGYSWHRIVTFDLAYLQTLLTSWSWILSVEKKMCVGKYLTKWKGLIHSDMSVCTFEVNFALRYTCNNTTPANCLTCMAVRCSAACCSLVPFDTHAVRLFFCLLLLCVADWH